MGLERTPEQRGSRASRHSGDLRTESSSIYFSASGGGMDWTWQQRAVGEAQTHGAGEEASVAIQGEDDACLNEGYVVGMKRSQGTVSCS